MDLSHLGLLMTRTSTPRDDIRQVLALRGRAKLQQGLSGGPDEGGALWSSCWNCGSGQWWWTPFCTIFHISGFPELQKSLVGSLDSGPLILLIKDVERCSKVLLCVHLHFAAGQEPQNTPRPPVRFSFGS